MEENMNNLVENEAVEEITEAVADATNANHTGWKIAALIGSGMVLGATLWEKAVKPVGRKIKSAWQKRSKQKKANETDEAEEIDLEDMDLEGDDYEIPD